MSSTRTAGREQRSPGARTARTTRTRRPTSRRTAATRPVDAQAPDERVLGEIDPSDGTAADLVDDLVTVERSPYQAIHEAPSSG